MNPSLYITETELKARELLAKIDRQSTGQRIIANVFETKFWSSAISMERIRAVAAALDNFHGDQTLEEAVIEMTQNKIIRRRRINGAIFYEINL